MLDPIVHGALVVLAKWFVTWLFTLIGLDLGGEIATQLAEVIVAYILSLFGLALYQRGVAKNALLGNGTYKPPFV